MKIIAVTCARMASTRFPGKCLAILDGKPLIQHTIDFARSIGIQLYTFTRDQEIIEYVKDKTPIIYEPIELYDTPQNTTYEKMQYVNRILDADYVILLQPTQPVRNIKLGLGIIDELERHLTFQRLSDYIFSIDEKGNEDGCYYVFSKGYLKEKGEGISFENIKSFDINTPEDLKRCEEWLQKRK